MNVNGEVHVGLLQPNTGNQTYDNDCQSVSTSSDLRLTVLLRSIPKKSRTSRSVKPGKTSWDLIRSRYVNYPFKKGNTAERPTIA